MLKTEDILLRAVEPGDIDFLLTMENDPGVWGVSSNLSPYSRFQMEQYVLNAPNDVVTNRQLRLIIEWKAGENGVLKVGAVDLFEIDLLHRRAGIGVLILKLFQNKGFGSQALEQMKTYVKQHLQLHQLHCIISKKNSPSIHVFEKAGFTRCGSYKHWLREGVRWNDACIYQLIFDE